MAVYSYEEIEYRYNPYTKQLEKIDLSEQVVNDIKAQIEVNKENIDLTVAMLDDKANKAFILSEINLSTEWVRIAWDRIQIDWTTVFSSWYDPSTKINSWWAATDINTNTTTISWWKITTWSITASKMSVSELSAITADIWDINAWTITWVTITWWTIRTATSGKRIQLDSTNWLTAVDSSWNTRIRLTDFWWDWNPTLAFFSSSWTNIWEIRPWDLWWTEENWLYINNNIWLPSTKKYYIWSNYLWKHSSNNVPMWWVYSWGSFWIPVLTTSYTTTATATSSIVLTIQSWSTLKNFRINALEV